MAVLYQKDNEKVKEQTKVKSCRENKNWESMLVSSSKYIVLVPRLILNYHKNKAAKQVKETAKMRKIVKTETY